MTMTLNLHEYDWIVVNSSGGKDSQVALWEVVRLATLASYPLDKIVVSHADLGHVEWKGVKELVQKQADFFGLRCEFTKYRNKDGEEKTLLDYVRKRGKWPDSKNRYCTSDFKRGPGNRVITMLHREIKAARGPAGHRPPTVRFLNVFGFRAEESKARAERPGLSINLRASTKVRADGSYGRMVQDWLPIHKWEEHQVWETIRTSGMPYHVAYDKGMTRLSCCFCIFAPKAALMIAGTHNPELLEEYVQLEAEIDHTFKAKSSLADIQKAIKAGEGVDLDSLNDEWNM